MLARNVGVEQSHLHSAISNLAVVYTSGQEDGQETSAFR